MTVPAVDFVSVAPLPSRIALMEPPSTAKDVPVRVPLLIVAPFFKLTAPTVWLVAPRSTTAVPPSAVSAPVVAPKVPAPAMANNPAVTVVPPS